LHRLLFRVLLVRWQVGLAPSLVLLLLGWHHFS
jgi:hypothetical protein